MNNIILFKSKKHILVEENYNEFIKFGDAANLLI